uniref:Ig-like domain-containing protein n=1 Tax=Poecilia latipinna TaxID=48699 RepID=A0A3B3VDU2_9TELE
MLSTHRSNLTVINVTRYDDGSYSCHVSNPASSASSDPRHLSVSCEFFQHYDNLFLKLIHLLELNSYLQHHHICKTSSVNHVSNNIENVNLEPPSHKYPEGLKIHLNCSADSRPPATFEWFFNGNVLPDSGPQLELPNFEKNQSGNYSCQAFNSITKRYQTSQVSWI